MIWAVEHFGDGVERQGIVFCRDGAVVGHHDAQKLVALAIFALAALEEAAQNGYFLGSCGAAQALLPVVERER